MADHRECVVRGEYIEGRERERERERERDTEGRKKETRRSRCVSVHTRGDQVASCIALVMVEVVMLVVVVVSTGSGLLPTLDFLSLSLSLLLLFLLLPPSPFVSSIRSSALRRSLLRVRCIPLFSVHSSPFFSLRVLCVSRAFSLLSSRRSRPSFLPASSSSHRFSCSFSASLFSPPSPSLFFSLTSPLLVLLLLRFAIFARISNRVVRAVISLSHQTQRVFSWIFYLGP